VASSSHNSFGIEPNPGVSGVPTVKDPTEGDLHTEEHKTSIVQRILLGELTAEQACEQEGLTTEELTEWVRVYRRATRRAVDDQLAAALSAQGLEVDDFVLSGNLESMAVAELIQTIQYGRKDAHIRIEHDGAHSHIWCMDGDVIDARCGKLVGAPAVYRLLSLRHGRLQADFSKVARAHTIEASTQALMLESAKRFDECRALRERIGDMTARYVQSPTALTGEALLEPAQREVLRAFDGSRDVETVVRESAMPDLETLGTIARLCAESWITLQPLELEADATLPSPAQAPVSSRRSLQLSVLPFAASLRARLSEPVNTRRWVWAGLLTGAAALPLAFAVGFWSARQQSEQVSPPETGAAPRAAAVGFAPALCGAEMALIQPPSAVSNGPEGGGPLPPFCLGTHEVTTGQYSGCVAAGKCQAAQSDFDPAAAAEPSSDPLAHCNSGRPGHERHPMNCVTFRQAEEYCAWRGGRLPTESEWEFAAKESAGSAGGLSDLFGSVSEWTSGRVAARNPSTPHDASNDLYVVLGGGLAQSSGTRNDRPTRLYMNASTQGRSVGFRCALGVETTASKPAR
jgi:hypothetical protein